MDVLMTQRRPITRSTRSTAVQSVAASGTSRPVAATYPPPQGIQAWMVPAAQVKTRGDDPSGSASPTRAALAYKAAKTAVGTK